GRRRIPFVPAHSASKTRVNALMAGTQNHGPRPLDSRLRGNERNYAFASNNTSSFPRRVFCARGLHLCFAHPERGVGGAPRDVRALGGPPGGRANNAARRALARPLASHAAAN